MSAHELEPAPASAKSVKTRAKEYRDRRRERQQLEREVANPPPAPGPSTELSEALAAVREVTALARVLLELVVTGRDANVTSQTVTNGVTDRHADRHGPGVARGDLIPISSSLSRSPIISKAFGQAVGSSKTSTALDEDRAGVTERDVTAVTKTVTNGVTDRHEKQLTVPRPRSAPRAQSPRVLAKAQPRESAPRKHHDPR